MKSKLTQLNEAKNLKHKTITISKLLYFMVVGICIITSLQMKAQSNVFSDYAWLSTLVDSNNCSNESITVYDAGAYDFLFIETATSASLYYQNGTFYCKDIPGYSCVEAYRLNNVSTTWLCGTLPNEIPGCTDPLASNYNPQATTDDSSCTYNECNRHTGTFFFENCGGQLYYFIELDNGKIYDPYFADGIDFYPYEGQVVNFDFVPTNTITTPCTVSEAPIIVTCIKEIRPYVFEAYPWISNIVDPNNCNGEQIIVYDAGNYDFITIRSTSGVDLYYQNGTFYCTETPRYACIEAYSLSNIADAWRCGDETFDIHGCTDAAALNYNPAANIDNSSCTYKGNCTNYTGSFFYKDCSGTNFYFIRLADGTVYDPYLADGIEFYPEEGQVVNFDFEINNDITLPCTVAEAAITVTCIEAVRDFAFEVYPWLNTLVNINDCNDEIVKVYDGGGYEFLTIESASGVDMYYQDGTYYCSNQSNFSCTTLYGLQDEVDSWTCGEMPLLMQGLENTYLSKTTFANKDKATAQKIAKHVFNMYPNPANGKVTIDLPSDGVYQISLANISGKVMKHVETAVNTTTVEIDVTGLPKGMYMATLKSESGQLLQKLLIE